MKGLWFLKHFTIEQKDGGVISRWKWIEFNGKSSYNILIRPNHHWHFYADPQAAVEEVIKNGRVVYECIDTVEVVENWNEMKMVNEEFVH